MPPKADVEAPRLTETSASASTLTETAPRVATAVGNTVIACAFTATEDNALVAANPLNVNVIPNWKPKVPTAEVPACPDKVMLFGIEATAVPTALVPT